MVYYNPLYNWIGCHPLYNLNNQGFFNCSPDLFGMVSLPDPNSMANRDLQRLGIKKMLRLESPGSCHVDFWIPKNKTSLPGHVGGWRFACVFGVAET